MRLYKIIGPVEVPVVGLPVPYRLGYGYEAYLEVDGPLVTLTFHEYERRPTTLTKVQVEGWVASGVVESSGGYPRGQGNNSPLADDRTGTAIICMCGFFSGAMFMVFFDWFTH